METNKQTLTPNQQERIRNINGIQATVSLIGLVAGIVYAKKTGGGFWRYVGWSFVGSLVTGLPAQLIATPFKNKILKEGDTSVVLNTNTQTKSSKVEMETKDDAKA